MTKIEVGVLGNWSKKATFLYILHHNFIESWYYYYKIRV